MFLGLLDIFNNIYRKIKEKKNKKTKRLEKQVFILKRQFESERTARNRTTSSSTSSQSFKIVFSCFFTK
jgi:hypothetical protein